MILLRRVLMVLLYGYTGHYLLFRAPSFEFSDLLEALSEPLTFSIFMALGLMPLGFLLYFVRFVDPLQKRHKIALIGSFFLGAFALEWALIQPYTTNEKTVSNPHRWSVKGGLGLSVLLILMALVLGDVTVLIESMNTQPFIHIMVIDGIVLWLLSLTLEKPQRFCWTTSLPLVGLFVRLLD